MLLVLSGNDPEILVREMAKKMDRPRSPFSLESVLVGSPLQAGYFQRLLAQELGIFSGMTLIPPGSFLWRVVTECFPDIPRQNPLSKEVISLSLMEFFSRQGTDDVPLPDGIPFPVGADFRWELSVALAEIFDRMIIYRPDWILRWEKEGNSDDPWSGLWDVVRRGVSCHRVSLLDQFSIVSRKSPGLLKDKFFAKSPVHVIGHSLLPPSFLDFLQDLSRITDVIVYQWQPTDVYFLGAGRSLTGDPLEGISLHPLTRALGMQSTRMRELFLSRNSLMEEAFSLSGKKSLLSYLQDGIIADSPPLSPLPGISRDLSVSIHSSKTVMGEVLALHQELLSAFSRDPSLSPGEVLVMVSDINLFAPFIDAVFHQKGDSPASIPFRVFGGRHQSTFEYLERFFQVARGKCSAAEVMGLLDHPLSKERFGLDNEDLERLERWISRLPVWWGIGPQMRRSFGNQEEHLNTFDWGIERLLLSFCLFEDSTPISGVAPFEGGDLWEVAPVLEKFKIFLSVLFELGVRSPEIQSCVCWGKTLRWIVSNLFVEEHLLTKERGVLEDLIALSQYFEPVNQEEERFGVSLIELPFSGFLKILSDRLSVEREESRGILGDSVTFSGMVAARGVPARFIALLGMSSDLFTLTDRTVSFDPLMKAPRSGDHSRREDDQGIFLEALLLARNRFFVSYSGSGQERLGEGIPSSPVSHLIDLVGAIDPDNDSIVIHHPLTEGFFPGCLRKTEKSPAILVPEDALEQISASFPDRIELSRVRRFLKDPSDYFWFSWAGRSLGNGVSHLASSDPFTLDFMEERTLGKKIFGILEERGGILPSIDDVASWGLLPHGEMGKTVFDSLSVSVGKLWHTKDFVMAENQLAKRSLRSCELQSIPGRLGFPFELLGSLEGHVFAGEDHVSHLIFLPYRHSIKDRISVWLDHLLLSILFEGISVISTIYSRFGLESYSCRTDPKRDLRDIFSLFSQGHLLPVPLFPKSAKAYVVEWRKSYDRERKAKMKKGENDQIPSPAVCRWGSLESPGRRRALESARKIWETERQHPDHSPEEDLLHRLNPPWEDDAVTTRLLEAEKMALRVIAPMEVSLMPERDV